MKEGVERVERMVDEVRAAHAPDPRLVVFDVRVRVREGRIAIEGASSARSAEEAIRERMERMGIEWTDSVERLTIERYAIVIGGVAPVHARGSIRSTQVSQAMLGSVVRILRQRGRWHQCRFSDGYLGWVHEGYLSLVSEDEAERWEDRAQMMSLGAELTQNGRRVGHLVWGARFEEPAAHRARLPDGEVVEVAGEVVPISELPTRFPATREHIVETADRWIGTPYLWGGRTRAGVDCSGLVQMVYGIHGIRLPRDSDQQALVGHHVEAWEDFSGLLPGDLLFFTERPDGRITHVALSEGGSKIVHAWLGGGKATRTDILNPTSREAHLRESYRLARRILV